MENNRNIPLQLYTEANPQNPPLFTTTTTCIMFLYSLVGMLTFVLVTIYVSTYWTWTNCHLNILFYNITSRGSISLPLYHMSVVLATCIHVLCTTLIWYQYSVHNSATIIIIHVIIIILWQYLYGNNSF